MSKVLDDKKSVTIILTETINKVNRFLTSLAIFLILSNNI